MVGRDVARSTGALHSSSVTRLTRQCADLSLPLIEIPSAAALDRNGDSSLAAPPRPEELALEHFVRGGYRGSWCEGATLKLLMKATCFAELVRLDSLRDRAGVCSHFFEGQCVVLKDHQPELLRAIAESTRASVAAASDEILSNRFVREWFPRVRRDLLLELWDTLTPQRVANVAQVFMTAPYDLRSGWPDLLLLGQGAPRFVEVKTTDALLASQVRLVRTVAHPLRLDFAVAHVY